MPIAHERHGPVAVLRLHYPPVNAFDLAIGAAFERALEDALASEPAALVLTGTGPCFSAGLNLKTVPRYDAAAQRTMIETANRLLGRLYACPLPTVAALNGHAIAAGLVLALACDHRVGPARDAHFGLTEVRVGIPFPGAAMAIVRAELSPAAARTLVLLGRRLDGEQAAALGIVDEVQPAAKILSRAVAVATDLASMPRGGYARIKHQLRAPAIAAIAALANGADPMAGSWLDDDASPASRLLLGR